VSRQSQQIVEL